MAQKRSNRKKGTVHPAGLAPIRSDVAGIDIGSREHWVCVPAREDGQPNVRVFATTTAQLEALLDWLQAQQVTSVAMESTSVYWIPLYDLLASRGIDVVLVNARHLHTVPGRKTDMIDCQWLQTLHAHGLLRGSFRPDDAIVRLRALQRQQANLVEQRVRCIQWMQKTLDQMNVRVHQAVTDLTGTTGMAIVRAIVAGERDPVQLAKLRDMRCGKSEEQIAEYLRGTWRDEHLFNLQSTLAVYDALDATIARYDERLLQELAALQPPERREESVPRHPNAAKERVIRARGEHELRTTLWRFCGADLLRIDGIRAGAARVILTEVGADLGAFPSEKHFVSWLRLCPRTAISGGKPLRKRRNGLGANRIASVLRMAALALQRSKTALGAAFRRTARHKGGAVAVFAIARKLAQLVYRVLRTGQQYVDIGEAAYEQQFRTKRLAGIKEAARSLGYALVANSAEAHS
jgi:transposase